MPCTTRHGNTFLSIEISIFSCFYLKKREHSLFSAICSPAMTWSMSLAQKKPVEKCPSSKTNCLAATLSGSILWKIYPVTDIIKTKLMSVNRKPSPNNLSFQRFLHIKFVVSLVLLAAARLMMLPQKLIAQRKHQVAALWS